MGEFGVGEGNLTEEEQRRAREALALPSLEQMIAELSPDAIKFLEGLPGAVANSGQTVGVGVGKQVQDPFSFNNVADMWSHENRGDPRADTRLQRLAEKSDGLFGFSNAELFAIIVTLGLGVEFRLGMEAVTAGEAAAPAGTVAGPGGGNVPAGSAAAPTATPGAAPASTTGSGLSKFLSNPLTNLGINLGTSFLEQRAAGKANEANQRATDARIAQALAALSPEEIAKLTQQFIPEIAAVTNAPFQAQQQALQTAGARAGFTGNQADTNLQQTLQTGLRGQQINQNASLAFQQALQLGGQRASVITGIPIAQQQNPGSFGPSIQDSFNQFLKQQTTLNQQRQQQNAGVPFTLGRGGPRI